MKTIRLTICRWVCLTTVILTLTTLTEGQGNSGAFLEPLDLKVGVVGHPHTDLRVIQVIDDDLMIILLRDKRTLRESKMVALKWPTQDLADGQYFQDWEELTGNKQTIIKVTGTQKLKTAAGGTRTLLLLEVRKSK